MARTYLDSDGVTSLVQKIRQNFYAEGDAIVASTVTASGTVDANLLVGKIANSSDDTAGSTVGSATQPVYLNSGVITATGSSLDVDISGNAATATNLGTATVGSGTKPIYLNNGVATASNSTVGSSTKPIYLSNGALTASNSTVGSGTKPVYLNGGTITPSSSDVGSSTKPIYMSGGTLTPSDSTIGSSTLPVYLSSGTITQTGTSLAVDVTGNAATATKLANARTIRTDLESTSSASFDGSADITPGVTGILPVANGGTGATSIDGILSNLGIISNSEIDETFELVMGD